MFVNLKTSTKTALLLFFVAYIACVQALLLLTRISHGVAHVLICSSAILAAVASGFLIYTIMDRLDRFRHREKDLELRLQAVSGDIGAVIDARFEEWHLSDSEKEVALFMIKGFSNQEISDLRGTALATTKSQVSTVLRKSDVNCRQKLASMLVDDVVDQRMAELAGAK